MIWRKWLESAMHTRKGCYTETPCGTYTEVVEGCYTKMLSASALHTRKGSWGAKRKRDAQVRCARDGGDAACGAARSRDAVSENREHIFQFSKKKRKWENSEAWKMNQSPLKKEERKKRKAGKKRNKKKLGVRRRKGRWEGGEMDGGGNRKRKKFRRVWSCWCKNV